MWDGIIIGGGLAGLMAGIRASERGKRSLIISEGVGSLTYSSGALDFGDVERLQTIDKHPYALLGSSTIRAGQNYFQTLFPDYQGSWGACQELLTPLGTPRKTDLAPEGLRAQALSEASQIVLVVPEGLKDFFPEVIKSNLERSYPQCEVSMVPVRIPKFEPWHSIGKAVAGMDYARFWKSEAGQEILKDFLLRLAEQLKGNPGQLKSTTGKSVAVFPGLATFLAKSLKELIAGGPLQVVEITSFPPSPHGQFLYEALKQKFRSLGGELLVGSGVKQVKLQGNRCEKVIVHSKGKDTAYAAQTFILATGGIFGGGIEVRPEAAREQVFGLPLFLPTEWTRPEFLGEQPYAKMGIETDRDLRPVDPRTNQVVLNNLRVVGRSLAHWDPWVERCGGGVSLASGWLAGERI